MVVTYRYDRMNRLVCEDRGGEGERYAYDPAGNRLEREHYRDGTVDGAETYRYNERNELTCRINRLTGSAATYRYDACGNLLLEEEGGKKKEYGYDALNRLARVRTADGREWENLYDGEGLRAGTRGDGACTTFLYRNGEILAECGEDGEPVSRYVYGSGLSHVQTLRDGVYHAYHRDEQGSTAYMTGPGGGVENSYRYDAFGNLLERKETVPNRILYTGQRYDQETGQYYLRARYYNPVVGRFLQEDTYHGDGLNLYAYCGNNPVVYYDPSGHDSAAVMKKAEEPDLPVGVGKGGTGAIHNVSELSNEQIEALIKYTGDDYANINNSLRGVETLTPENRATVEAMKSALDNSALPQDMTLYRGTSTEALGSLQNLSVDELVGKTFTEQGFMSTSTSNVVAEGFSGNIKMTIEASRGAQALDISSISQYTTEAEVLFNTGQEMLITSAEVKDGILYITVIIE